MKVFLLLFIATFFTSCDFAVNENVCKKPDKYDLANTLIAETAFRLQKDNNLIPFGTGRQICDQIQMLALSFIYYKEIEIEEARELLMDAFKVFAYSINSNEKIRPYLCEYPFDQHLEIRIFFNKANGHERDFGNLNSCAIIKGKLDYTVKNSKYNSTFVLIETYEEAQQKLGIIDL